MNGQDTGAGHEPLLGCVADDFTGATDLAGVLVLNGMRTTVTLGTPESSPAQSTEAIVIALKTRTAPRAQAVDQSLQALRWLRNQGCRKFFFKYCSTFDSTSEGNIGPVAEAFMKELGTDFTVACPAFPANGRTVDNGYLFVGDSLLHESSMATHPLTPMTDSNLVRLLQAQTVRRVGLIRYKVVQQGVLSIAKAIAQARAGGTNIAVVDAVSETDLRNIAFACDDLPLLTGASGLAIGIPEALRMKGLIDLHTNAGVLPHVPGFSAVLSGSCSETTQRQVEVAQHRLPIFLIDPFRAATDSALPERVAEWAGSRLEDGPVLISATSGAAAVKSAQASLGVAHAGLLVETALAQIACRLVQHGVRRLIVAGGETSGAVVQALGVRSLRVGPQIAPGVHWAVSDSERPLALALKSGNFGSDDFFTRAWGLLP